MPFYAPDNTYYESVAADIELTPSATGSAEATVTTNLSNMVVDFQFNVSGTPDSLVMKRLGGVGATSSITISQSTPVLRDKNRIYTSTASISISGTPKLRRDINILEPSPASITIDQQARISGAINLDKYFTLNVDYSAVGELALTLPVITRAQPWWNHNYLYRRVLDFTVSPTGLPADHPVTIYVPKNIYLQGKSRGDNEDIEVVYLETEVPENWILLGRQVTDNELYFKIDTEIPVELLGDSVNNSRLFVYYGNAKLANVTARPSYSINEWPLTASYDSKYVSYTKGWEAGVSSTPREKAVFVFYGPHARLNCAVGPDKGIAEVQIDNGEWENIDLYRHTAASEYVYTTEELGEGRHQFRVRVTGDKNPSSTGTEVQILSFGYRNHSTWIDVREEHDETLLWGGSTVGT